VEQDQEIEEIARLKREEEIREEKRRTEKRRAEERRLQRLEQQRIEKEVREQKQAEEYLKNHTTTELLVKFLRTLKQISGNFRSLQAEGRFQNKKESINIDKVIFRLEQHRIEIIDTNKVKFYIYLLETNQSSVDKVTFSNAYTTFHLYLYSKENIVEEFQKQFYCRVKGKTRTVHCTAIFDCPNRIGNKECGLTDTTCTYGEIKWSTKE